MNYVICPVRNCLPLTQIAVKSFLSQDIGDVRVILIDNGSTDETGPWARAQEGVSHVNRSRHNGVSKAWNLGLKYVFESMKEPYALVSNNDVMLRNDFYRKLVEHGGGFVSGMTVEKEDDLEGIAKHSKHPDFSCFLIRREVWEQVGAFDEEMMLYASDCDYHIRMHQKGIMALNLGIPFLHFRSSTLKHLPSEEADAVRKQADADREVFKGLHGCMPWEPEYDELFK